MAHFICRISYTYLFACLKKVLCGLLHLHTYVGPWHLLRVILSFWKAPACWHFVVYGENRS